MEEKTFGRRRLLRLSGLSTVAGIAGCLRLGNGGGDQTETLTGTNVPTQTPTSDQTPTSSPGNAQFTFEYSAQERTVRINCDNGGGIEAGDVQIQSTAGKEVLWPDLGSTVAGPDEYLSSGATAILGGTILNWGQSVSREETIRLVYRGQESPVTIGRYTPPRTTTVTTSVPPTESTTSTPEPDPTTTEDPTTQQTTTSQGRQTIVDDFESGSLAPAWRSEFDTSESRGGDDGGLEAYDVQSEIAPEGSFALRGNKDLYYDGTSTILRDDFHIDTDGTSIRFYAKLGEVLDGAERDNRINLFDDSLEERALMFRDKRRDWDNLIVSEKLQSVQLIEIQGISFGDNVIDEIRIGGETIESDFPLGSEIDNISAIRLDQGHYAQPADLIFDSFVIERPD